MPQVAPFPAYERDRTSAEYMKLGFKAYSAFTEDMQRRIIADTSGDQYAKTDGNFKLLIEGIEVRHILGALPCLLRP